MRTHSSPYSSKTRSNSVLPSLSAASKACQQLVSQASQQPPYSTKTRSDSVLPSLYEAIS